MKLNIYHSELAETARTKNLTMAIAVMLLIATCIQSIVIYYLAGRERVILVPPQLEQEVWIEGDQVSRSYLEQMTLFFSSLALNITPDNAEFKHQKLLRFVDPRVYGKLKARLGKEAEILKQRNISTIFQPVELEINDKNLTVDIHGDFVTLVGQTETSKLRATYRTRFINRHGQWFVSEFRGLNDEE